MTPTRIGGLLLLLLAGCAVGPELEPPATPPATRFTAEPLPAETASADTLMGDAQQFLVGRDVPARWWEQFGSESLDRLVEEALRGNPTLEKAHASLREAEHRLLVRRGERWPSADLQAGASRQKFSGAAYGQPEIPSTTLTLYEASVGVSYDLDLFGGQRRAVEAFAAEVERQRFERDAVYLTLIANVATHAIGEASLRAQISATEAMIAVEAERLERMRQQQGNGSLAGAAVVAQAYQLESLRSQLPPLRQEAMRLRHQLALLTGKTPESALPAELEFTSLRLPLEIPVSVPSEWLQRRPDIQQAEALVRVAAAQVGVAAAHQFPQLSIRGRYGSTTTELSDLFSADSMVWNLGAGLTQPIFRAGALEHEKQAAIAAYEAAVATFRETVLDAFRETAAALDALRIDADLLNARAAAAAASARHRAIAEAQFEAGAINRFTLMDARRDEQEAALALTQAKASRLLGTVALFQALGGDRQSLP